MSRRVVILLVLAFLVGGGVVWRTRSGADAAVQTPKPAARIPVKVAEARRGDVPIALSGLGIVQPLNLVTIRSRADGAIVSIAYEEGQTVKEGDLLAQIDPRPYQASLDQAKAKQAQDEAQLANAERDLNRYQQLAQSNFASRQQLDGQKAMVAQLKAQIDGDAAAVESAQVQFDYTTIRAPMAGRVGFRLADKGNLVRASDATGIVSLSQIQPITAVFNLPERKFTDVADAMKRSKVRAEATAPDGRALGVGELTVLNNQIDQATGTFKAKATFANTDGALWPGQSVSVKVVVDTLSGVVTVPEDALQRGPDGAFAFVVKDDSTADRRKIAVLREADGVAVISAGLAPGDRVVTVGASRVEQGSPLDAAGASHAAADVPPGGRDAAK